MDNKFYHGPIAGMVESVVMQPFDTIKVLKQSGNNKINPSSLYNGFLPFTTGMIIKYYLRFSVINKVNSDLSKYSNKNNLINFVSGFTAGFIESIFLTPFELVKTRLQTNPTKIKIKNIISTIYNEHGINGIYRGYLSTALRQSINQSMNILVYYYFRNSDTYEPTFLKTSLLGFVSGSLGPILNNPLDVVKTRYMNKAFNYKNWNEAFRDIIKKHGYIYLFSSGLYLRIIRVGIGQSIIFNTLETLKYYDL